MTKLAPLIDELEAARTAGDARHTLEIALTLWRRTRDPAVAAIIDGLGGPIASDDPRRAMALLDEPPTPATMRELGEIADPRTLPRLRQLLCTSDPAMDGEICRTIQEIEARGTPYLAARLQSTTADEPTLLARVYENPTDEATRAVLADHWLETDHPRGRFDEAAQHEHEWIGVLKRVTTHRVWERGFLVELSLAASDVAPFDVWLLANDEPALATVRIIRPGAASGAQLLNFMKSRRLRSMRETFVPSRKAIDYEAIASAVDLRFGYPIEYGLLRHLVQQGNLAEHLERVTFSFREREGSGGLVDLGELLRSARPEIKLAAVALDNCAIPGLVAPFLLLGRVEIRSGTSTIAFDGRELRIEASSLAFLDKFPLPFTNIRLSAPPDQKPQIAESESVLAAFGERPLRTDEAWTDVLRNRSPRQA